MPARRRRAARARAAPRTATLRRRAGATRSPRSDAARRRSCWKRRCSPSARARIPSRPRRSFPPRASARGPPRPRRRTRRAAGARRGRARGPRSPGDRAREVRARSNAFARAWLAGYGRAQGSARPARLRRPDRARPRAARTGPDVAAWVLYKLDGGIDHILVDEAQDTSPAQWEVIEAISAEFFAGARRARRPPRTHLRRRRREAVDLLLPGRRSGRLRRHARRASSGCSPTWAAALRALRPAAFLPLGARRSCALVDAVFAGPGGRGLAGTVAHHRRSRRTRPAASSSGRSCRKPDKPESALGRAARRSRPDDPVAVLADRIAGDDPRLARRRPRAARRATAARSAPGDVLILVQRRGADLRRDYPRAEARAACRSPGPTCCASAASSRSRDLLAALARCRATARATTCRWPRCCAARSAALREAELFRPRPRRGRATCGKRCAPPAHADRPRDAARPAGAGRLPAALRAARSASSSAMTAGAQLLARLGPEAEDGDRRAARPGAGLRDGRAAEPDRVSRLDRPRRGRGEAPARRCAPTRCG